MSHLLDYALALSKSLSKPMPSEEDLAKCAEKRDVRALFKTIEVKKASKAKPKKESVKSGEVKESETDSTTE